MCGRYTFSHEDKLAKRFDLKSVPKNVRPNFNVSPSQTMPVITNDGKQNQLEEMRWGIPRFIGPGKTVDVFNTRDDKAFGSWKKMVLTQRVLVPATGFYEWKKPERQRYFIHPKDIEMFSFAAICNEYENKETGEKIKAYSIITTDPNREMSGIHNRMPVILHQADESAWLSPSNDNDRSAIEALLRPYEDNGLDLFEDNRDFKVIKSNEELFNLPNSK